MDLQTLTPFELRQICYFITVVKSGNNLTQAAHRLGIKQPPLTQSIKALEKLLSTDPKTPEVKLFDRSTRPLQLTEAGQAFLEEAELALLHLERAISKARSARRGQFGRLVVGLNNAIANSILPEVLKEFQKQCPAVELDLREVKAQQEIQMLKSGELDVVFRRSRSFEQDDPELEFQTILHEYFVVALPTSHPLAKQTRIPLKALENEPLILPSLDVLPFYEEVIHLCRRAGFEPKIMSNISITGVVTLLSLVASEKGISILPNHVLTLERDGVTYLPIQDKILNRQIAVVWRGKDASNVLLNFLNVILQIMDLPLIDGW